MKYEFKRFQKVMVNPARAGGYNRHVGKVGHVLEDVSTDDEEFIVETDFEDRHGDNECMCVFRLDKVGRIWNE